jgi:copper chaperone NosL
MLNRRRFLALLGTATPVIAAAGMGYRLLPGDSVSETTPDIAWHKEPCATCGMVISDVRFAAAWITEGRQVHFDDVGCMVTAIKEHGRTDVAGYYVCEFASGDWIDAGSAVYFQSAAFRSPMAYGIAAFSSRAQGEAEMVSAGVTVLEWEVLLESLERRS